MKLLDGKSVSERILDTISKQVRKEGIHPHVAVILVGNDAASHLYVSLKEKAAQSVGIDVSLYKFLAQESQDSVLECLELLNKDEEIDGILVQLPLPESFNTDTVIKAISPEKDVDGFSAQTDMATVGEYPKLVPVFPRAIIQIMKSSGENLVGKNAVIIANSNEFGRTMSTMLECENMAAEYVLAADLPSNLGKIKVADVVISAVGSPGLLSGEMFKDGAIVIDGGIEKVAGVTVGDVDFASTEEKEGFITPVPGGVGPVTIACLLENVLEAALRRRK